MSKDQSLSHSRAYVHSKCRKAYAYKYVDKVRPLPSTLHLDSWERMQRGTLIHAGMEGGLLGRRPDEYIADTVAEQRKKYGYSDEQENMLSGMISDSLEVVKCALDFMPVYEWEPCIGPDGKPMVEYELRMPLPGWRDFLGYADLVARHKPTGGVYVLDYKARASFERDDMDKYNSQFCLYQKALGEIGVPVIGSILFEIKPTPPKRAPRITRVDSGSLAGIRISEDGRFRLTPTLRSKDFVDGYWEDFKLQAKAIASLHPDDAYRSMNGFNCSSCEYEKLCMAELRGDDVAAVLSRHYSVPRESLKIVEEL